MSNLTASKSILTALAKLSRGNYKHFQGLHNRSHSLYRNSQSLHNNLKALVNMYPNWKEKKNNTKTNTTEESWKNLKQTNLVNVQ
jgi:hypothetical protein